ncbi:alpha/beta hydrolase-fold protein [Roseimaritima sediminicola]|uniref:alpha/beta hydrolase-fold protein n=1 Tax=Roseimaritima sediminicola TaxID=2662066 RepID=UPI0012983C83
MVFTRTAGLLLLGLWTTGSVAAAAPVQAAASDPADERQGQMRQGEFTDSEIFPGTTRTYRVYVPAQYDASQEAALMVFMDGRNYAKASGPFRIPRVFDQLIAAGQMPVTIAVFVDPGTISATKAGAANRSNRSFEYDSLGDRYARFLIDELLPVALEGLNVSTDPAERAVGGISSGAIAAFTVAWERPDQFGKVLSHIGSYTNIRGGGAYPGLIRQTKSQPKPIKVYLQDGRDDLDNLHGHWPLGNEDMAAALQFAGYTYKLEMTDGGHSGKWAGERLPAALRWLWSDSAESTNRTAQQTKPDWQPHPDALVKSDVPQGKVHKMPPWRSKVLANTVRDWAIYVPAQYDPQTPAALMVFQDGQSFLNPKGRWRVPVVFDNLIASGDMPPTIAVFLNPGHDTTKPRRPGGKPSDRGLEYDSLGDRYARFLAEEILPEVRRQYNLSDDPSLHAIGGSSSGGICSFTVAWERPELFRKVFSNVGSFVNLRGGDAYPGLVRKTEPKPLRVYMADTSGDLDNPFGHWPIANRRMAAALNYMGYDVRFDWAEGYSHSADFAGERFPEAMRWLWRSESHRRVIDTSDDLKGDLTLLELLIPGEDWQVVADDLGFVDAPCADEQGNFYFCDMRAPAVYRLDPEGNRHLICEEAVSGLEFGPDGRLFACQAGKKRVITIDPDSGQVEEVASGFAPNDLAIASDGNLYITETRQQKIVRVNPDSGAVLALPTEIAGPNGIALSPDEGTLAVSDHRGPHVWMFRVQADGSLDAAMPSMSVRLPIDAEGEFRFNQPPPYLTRSRGDGMAVDSRGRYYVTTAVGIQIFDPTGRLCGVLPAPRGDQPLVSCAIGGPAGQYLYVANGNAVLRRKLQVR